MLTFTTHDERHYNAVGAYGIHYTITEDHDGEPILYYVEGTNTEHTTFSEAIAYCEALEATEASTHKCHALGIRAFGDWTESNKEIDFLYNAVDDLSFIYCPNGESVRAFVEFTKCCVDSYALSFSVELSYSDNSEKMIFKYNAHRDAFEPIDDNICRIIDQLIK